MSVMRSQRHTRSTLSWAALHMVEALAG
jgi:hypothetical protein